MSSELILIELIPSSNFVYEHLKDYFVSKFLRSQKFKNPLVFASISVNGPLDESKAIGTPFLGELNVITGAPIS